MNVLASVLWLPCLLAIAPVRPRTDDARLTARSHDARQDSWQSPASEQNLAPSPEALTRNAIKKLLEQQAADWNRGDLDAFARGYKHSPDILFMGGATIRRGYDSMLQRYKESYPTRERMGRLAFSELDVQPLGSQFATATGHFHLERTAAGGGNADGFFLLVLEQTKDNWKIVRDDTTALPAARK